ncbi:hypothetical protein H0H92_002847 [Tricholoma furcatifolium]|nr:hypothetical protein H0H92_002847 [Tricholoma furcatifolium]
MIPQAKKKSKPLSAVSLAKLEPGPSSQRRFDPLTAVILSRNSLKTSEVSRKGKGKITKDSYAEDAPDDRLWVDIYEPKTEAELAVHKRKVDDVRRWFQEAFEGGPSGNLKKYRRILALTGPAGTGKTSTVRVLAKEMGFDIMEWKNGIGESARSMFAPASSQLSASSPSSSSTRAAKRHIILLEDLPNLLHPSTQSQFHSALQALVTVPVSNPPVPVVVIVSDAGVRGEVTDERIYSAGGWSKTKEGVVDIRTVLPRDLLGGPFVTQIAFNPIAPTLMTKALQTLFNTASPQSMVTKEVLDAIVDSANGDIRSAIMSLQFACVVEMSHKARKKKGSKTVVMEAITRREQSLVLFHLLGKVMYNKRKGDPSSSSATAKDIQKEKLLDAQLKDPPKLPPDFQGHERRASRINVDNYPQFCDQIDQCDGVVDWLSWIDSAGGDTWYQANPHQFHLLTLGTIHSLPSPVARRSQKITKPVFFECLQKEKDAWEGVRDARGWALGDGVPGQVESRSGWSLSQVAVELGGVLKARDQTRSLPRPPASHRLFSNLTFSLGAPFGVIEGLDATEMNPTAVDEHDNIPSVRRKASETEGGWLENDDIEEF